MVSILTNILRSFLYIGWTIPQAMFSHADMEIDMSLVILASPGQDQNSGWLYESYVGLEADKILDNGTKIGINSQIRAQKDHGNRQGFSGALGACQPGLADCPFVRVDGVLRAPVGGFSGLSGYNTKYVAGSGETARQRVSLESVYVYINGGWGEVSLGRDSGVAARFWRGGPDIFRYGASANAILDPTGLRLARTRHDIAGPALKLSATSPRILGLRAGFSYTPKADVPGLDRDPIFEDTTSFSLRPEEVIELAFDISRQLPKSGGKLQLGGAISFANPKVTYAEFDQINTRSLGASYEKSGIKIGASWLKSDNGWAKRNGDYEATQIAIQYKRNAWRAGASFAQSSDALANLSNHAFNMGVSYQLSRQTAINLGYYAVRTGLPEITQIGRGGSIKDASGLQLELYFTL